MTPFDTVWDRAGAIIDRTFRERTQIVYTGAGVTEKPIDAIRSESPAPGFDGAGNTLATITYEISRADLPERPTKDDTFAHRDTTWRVQNVNPRDDIGKWELIVSDEGDDA